MKDGYTTGGRPRARPRRARSGCRTSSHIDSRVRRRHPRHHRPVAMNPAAAYPVEESSQVAAARRAAIGLAERLGILRRAGRPGGARRLGARDQSREARDSAGEILLLPHRGRRLAAPGPDGIEILAIDSGPGMPDVARVAARRLFHRRARWDTASARSNGSRISSRSIPQPSGTVALARIWSRRAGDRRRAAAALRDRRRPRLASQAKTSAATTGAGGCGTIGSRSWSPTASVTDWPPTKPPIAAIAVFHRYHEQSPAARDRGRSRGASRDAWRGSRDGRGRPRSRRRRDTAASATSARSCISADGARHSLVSHNGTAGHTATRIHEFSYPRPAAID